MIEAQAAVVDDIISIRDRYHTRNHPFFDAWASGALTLEQMGRYMAQHYVLVQEILRPYGIIYARAPHDVQAFVIENLAEEEGLIGENHMGPGKNHNQILLRWTETCGLSVAEVTRDTRPVPHLRGLLDMMWRLAYRDPWEIWMAAQACLESQQVGIQERTVPALARHYGFGGGNDRVEWFEEHLTADVEHGRRAFQLVGKYVRDDDMADRCRQAVEDACKMRWLYMTDVHDLYVGGKSPALP
ncbi:MAG: TenA family transcriptional regulator [Chloroflexota bacterium]